MWKRLQALVKAITNPQATPPFDLDETKLAVQGIMAMDLSTQDSRESNDERVSHVLQRMDTEIEIVRKLANGYLANPIAASVWVSGTGYGSLASELANHFKKVGWLEREETTTALWAKAVLAVNGHYYHMVGPAMIANADCHDRLGDTERSSSLYAAVVRDFVILLDCWTDGADPPDDNERLALDCLQNATKRLLAGGTSKVDSMDLTEIYGRTELVLSRQNSSK